MNRKQRNPYFQHTIANPLHFVGRGLHNGKAVSMTLLPASADSGYVFERLDITSSQREIPARWHSVTETRLSTGVSNGYGVSVCTIEHLVAALFVCGVDNCRISIDGPEVPIMDGSARPFVEQIQSGELCRQEEERKALVVTNPVWVHDDERYAGMLPCSQPAYDVTIQFDSSVIGTQRYALPLNEELFATNVAQARTFGFEYQLATLKALGLAQGGTLQNAILIDEEGVVNEEGLRFEDEFVRHKTLDAIGDLALSGAVIFGRFVGHCSGHQLNNKLLRVLMNNRQLWNFTTVRRATEQWSEMLNEKSKSAFQTANRQSVTGK